jgi:hypothetical protein
VVLEQDHTMARLCRRQATSNNPDLLNSLDDILFEHNNIMAAEQLGQRHVGTK